jgi:hypothetical protein
MRSTRHFGRQSSSVATARWSGCRATTMRASVSWNPRIALLRLPSGARIAFGTPKKARKMRLEPSTRSHAKATED